jgi:hypothetical protein
MAVTTITSPVLLYGAILDKPERANDSREIAIHNDEPYVPGVSG